VVKDRKRILLAVDGSEQAFEAVVAAEPYGCRSFPCNDKSS